MRTYRLYAVHAWVANVLTARKGRRKSYSRNGRRRPGPVATKGFRSSRVAGGRRRQLQLLARPGAQATQLLPLCAVRALQRIEYCAVPTRNKTKHFRTRRHYTIFLYYIFFTIHNIILGTLLSSSSSRYKYVFFFLFLYYSFSATTLYPQTYCSARQPYYIISLLLYSSQWIITLLYIYLSHKTVKDKRDDGVHGVRCCRSPARRWTVGLCQ